MMPKRLVAALLVLLAVAAVGRAREQDVIERLKQAHAWIWVCKDEDHKDEDGLGVLLSNDAGDEGLAELCELRRLRSLGLSSTRVTDAGMRAVGGLTRLRYLDLHGLPVTDAGLRELAGLCDLE